MTIKLAAEVYRDYETDGVPSTGAHKPIKSDVRALLGAMETEIGIAAETIVTAAGAYTVLVTDRKVIIHRTASEAAAINMPSIAAAVAAGMTEVTIMDGAGVFDSFTQTLTPNGTDTIMGLATVPMTEKYGSITLYPYVRSGADVWIVKN